MSQCKAVEPGNNSFLSKKAETKKTSDLYTSQAQKCEQKVCCEVAKKHKKGFMLRYQKCVSHLNTNVVYFRGKSFM